MITTDYPANLDPDAWNDEQDEDDEGELNDELDEEDDDDGEN